MARRLDRRLQLAARRRPEKSRRGTPFGVELETGPSPTGYWAAAGPHHAPIRRQIDGFALGRVSLEPELVFGDVGVDVTLVS